MRVHDRPAAVICTGAERTADSDAGALITADSDAGALNMADNISGALSTAGDDGDALSTADSDAEIAEATADIETEPPIRFKGGRQGALVMEENR
ncbi:hypothetical protein CYMTET_56111 [Cymbomonas tetramitiformis]|uniref:Uncharacterized protein n=1 Tax=Cymbomonas tetramitiformis TaxID=36881 RepID=A0AAE0EP29_9CHLO|nr:hypothetical protein CYMTET_56111 [Cymbomonas tetramitiformis]